MLSRKKERRGDPSETDPEVPTNGPRWAPKPTGAREKEPGRPSREPPVRRLPAARSRWPRRVRHAARSRRCAGSRHAGVEGRRAVAFGVPEARARRPCAGGSSAAASRASLPRVSLEMSNRARGARDRRLARRARGAALDQHARRLRLQRRAAARAALRGHAARGRGARRRPLVDRAVPVPRVRRALPRRHALPGRRGVRVQPDDAELPRSLARRRTAGPALSGPRG